MLLAALRVVASVLMHGASSLRVLWKPGSNSHQSTAAVSCYVLGCLSTGWTAPKRPDGAASPRGGQPLCFWPPWRKFQTPLRQLILKLLLCLGHSILMGQSTSAQPAGVPRHRLALCPLMGCESACARTSESGTLLVKRLYLLVSAQPATRSLCQHSKRRQERYRIGGRLQRLQYVLRGCLSVRRFVGVKVSGGEDLSSGYATIARKI